MSVDTSGLEQKVRTYALDRAGELGEAFRDVVRGLVPRRTQELHDSIEVDRVDATPNGASATVRVGAPYANYVNDGTGIYGPEGRPITPTTPLTRDKSSKNGMRGGVLVFDWPAAGGLVFARSVKGMEPTHFWQRALERWPDVVRSL